MRLARFSSYLICVSVRICAGPTTVPSLSSAPSDVSSVEDEDLSSAVSDVPDLEQDPPSLPDPVLTARFPSVSSNPSVVSVPVLPRVLSRDRTVLRRFLLESLQKSVESFHSWNIPDIERFVDSVLPQSSFHNDLRLFAVACIRTFVPTLKINAERSK